MLPAPCDLGLPASFTAWRDGQIDAVLAATDTDRRFTGLVLPTGFGKSLVYMAIAHLTGRRTVILTATRALQRQLMRDFAALDAVLVQGQRSYGCRAVSVGGELYSRYGTAIMAGSDRLPTVDQAPCHLGIHCSLKALGCGYFDTVRAAQRTPLVITNYAWWMTLVKNPQVVLRPTLLVLDEAHDAPDQLASAIGAELPAQLTAQVLSERLPRGADLTAAQWVQWARTRAARIAAMLDDAQPQTRDAVTALRRAKLLLHSLDRIADMDPSLLLVTDLVDRLKFDLVWAAPYAEPWLFRHVDRVVLTSATMSRMTGDLLGIMEKDLHFYEAGDGFAVAQRPVYIAPARKPPFGEPLQADHRMDGDVQLQEAWIAQLDRVLDSRRDRKGIIHSVSYRRRDFILTHSAHRDRMVTHGATNAAEIIAAFKAAPPGTILVSPAVTTGYDFPYDECEFQIVAKIPFPDRRDALTHARTLIDARYPNHVAMQQLVQMVGRGMRAADDRCETFILDAHAVWFLSKHAALAPRWFRRAVRRLDAGSIPAAPPRLNRQASPAALETETL